MNALDIVKLTALMKYYNGHPDVRIGLIDSPVAMDHPDLAEANLREISGQADQSRPQVNRTACTHGTLVAGILVARRDSPAPAICPHCTVLARPIFAGTATGAGQMPSAAPSELASAIVTCAEAGVRVINLSVALSSPSPARHREVEEALDYASARGIIVVAAAGNQGTLGSSAITRHSGVIPVASCDSRGRPMRQSNFGGSLGRRGLSAPGDAITSLGVQGPPQAFGGTSAAAPFVTGAIGLLWSAFPDATASQVRFAVTQAAVPRRTRVIPPLLNAWTAYQVMATASARRVIP